MALLAVERSEEETAPKPTHTVLVSKLKSKEQPFTQKASHDSIECLLSGLCIAIVIGIYRTRRAERQRRAKRSIFDRSQTLTVNHRRIRYQTPTEERKDGDQTRLKLDWI